MSESIHANTHVATRLQQEPIIWLSTVRPDGRPHLVPVWFLWDGATILIFSKLDQKIRNLRSSLHVVLALEAAHSGDDVVLIEGTADLCVNEPSPNTPAYVTKYGALLAAMQMSVEQMAEEYNQAICITPTKLRAWS